MSKLTPGTYPVLVGLNKLEYLVGRSEKRAMRDILAMI